LGVSLRWFRKKQGPSREIGAFVVLVMVMMVSAEIAGAVCKRAANPLML
jgi:hypothetical protein